MLSHTLFPTLPAMLKVNIIPVLQTGKPRLREMKPWPTDTLMGRHRDICLTVAPPSPVPSLLLVPRGRISEWTAFRAESLF